MKYEKKLVILAGINCDNKGSATVERSAYGVRGQINLFNLPRIVNSEFLLIIKDTKIVPQIVKLGNGDRVTTSFVIDENTDLSLLHLIVGVKAQGKVVPLMYGTNDKTRLWQGNMLDGVEHESKEIIYEKKNNEEREENNISSEKQAISLVEGGGLYSTRQKSTSGSSRRLDSGRQSGIENFFYDILPSDYADSEIASINFYPKHLSEGVSSENVCANDTNVDSVESSARQVRGAEQESSARQVRGAEQESSARQQFGAEQQQVAQVSSARVVARDVGAIIAEELRDMPAKMQQEYLSNMVKLMTNNRDNQGEPTTSPPRSITESIDDSGNIASDIRAEISGKSRTASEEREHTPASRQVEYIKNAYAKDVMRSTRSLRGSEFRQQRSCGNGQGATVARQEVAMTEAADAQKFFGQRSCRGNRQSQQSQQNQSRGEQSQQPQSIRPSQQYGGNMANQQNQSRGEQSQQLQSQRPSQQYGGNMANQQNQSRGEQSQQPQSIRPSQQAQYNQQAQQSQQPQNIRNTQRYQSQQNQSQPRVQPQQSQFQQPRNNQWSNSPRVDINSATLSGENKVIPPPSFYKATAINDQPSSAKPKVARFYDTVKDQIRELFEKYPPETQLIELMPGTKWVRVDFDDRGKYYVVGLIGDKPDFICYGVPSRFTAVAPKELDGYCQWLPLDSARPQEEGFWLMYQDASSGESVNKI